MKRLIAVTGFAVFATATWAMPVSVPQHDEVLIQVRTGCGPGQVMQNGKCVSRVERRQDRRDTRRGN